MILITLNLLLMAFFLLALNEAAALVPEPVKVHSKGMHDTHPTLTLDFEPQTLNFS